MRRLTKCEHCQRPFVSYNPNPRFCSQQCYTASGARAARSRSAIETVKCKWCGTDFERFANRKQKSDVCGKDCPRRPLPQRADRLYHAWLSMRRRCKTSGIAMDSSWSQCETFRTWALSAGYAPGLILSRRNESIGYSPENCRWATRAQSQYGTRKRRNARGSRFKGVSWCKARGKWLMQIRKGTDGYIAAFTTEREAARAYDLKAIELFGDFARTNFPVRKRRRSSNGRS